MTGFQGNDIYTHDFFSSVLSSNFHFLLKSAMQLSVVQYLLQVKIAQLEGLPLKEVDLEMYAPAFTNSL